MSSHHLVRSKPRRRQNAGRVVGSALLLLLLTLIAPRVVEAHQADRNYCRVETVIGGIDVGVQTPVLTLLKWNEADTPSTEAELVRRSPEVAKQILGAVSATTDVQPCSVRVGRASIVTASGVRALQVPLHFSCPSRVVTLHNGWRLEASPYSEVLCAVDGVAVSFRAGHEEYVVGVPPSIWADFARFVGNGTSHVLGGLDHVLFLVCLLLASVLPPERSIRARFVSTLKLVTGFTFGHSVTLVLASYGLVHVAPRITEALIALSIAVVGFENVFCAKLSSRVVTATIFGLMHGLGFASALREVLPQDRTIGWSLLGFNVGVELGQLAVLCVVWPALAYAVRRPWYRKRLLVPLSSLVGVLALVWAVKRATGLDFLSWLGA